MIRVGGQIKKADLCHNLKNLVILPRASHVTEVINRHCHEKTQHGGRGLTLNEVRSRGYWIIGGNFAVRQFISRCVKYRCLRCTLGEQKMAHLPVSRLQPAPPFTYCGVDYFGP